MLARLLALALALLVGAPALALDASRMPPIMLGPGSSGEAGGAKVTVPGAQPYGLAERAADEVSVMIDIPEDLRPAIRNYTSTVDLTPYIRKTLARGKSVSFPDGRYPICDSLPLASGQTMRADSVTAAYLWVGPCFKLNAPAVVTVAVGDSSGWDGLGIRFDQSGATSRATLRQYPWALDISAATRFKLGRIRLGAAWNGIKCLGNCGGLDFGLIEVGAFNKGVLIDGPLDFVHGNAGHPWPFDIADNAAQMAVYLDGTTVGFEFGLIDGLDIKSLTTFGPRIVSNANGNDGAARQIGMLQLDGDNSTFTNLSGDWQFGLVSTTKSGNKSAPAFSVAAGKVTVGTMRTWGNNDGPFVKVTGGNLSIAGGSIELFGDHTAIEVSGGRLNLMGTTLYPLVGSEGPARTTPFVRQTGSGVLVASGNVAGYTANGGGGTLFGVEAANADTVVADNVMAGWGISLPSGASLGSYEGNIRPASPYVAGVAVGREYARRLTGTLDASGEAVVPHGVPAAQGVAPAERIFSFTANRVSGGGSRFPYPASTGTAWDGTSIFLKGGGAGIAGSPYEITVRYR